MRIQWEIVMYSKERGCAYESTGEHFCIGVSWGEKRNGFETLEELVMEKAKIGHNWKNPVWRNADGTVAEW